MQEAERELLIRYFYGKCSAKEKHKVQELLHNPEAEEFFRGLARNEWDEPVLMEDDMRALHARWKKNMRDHILSEKKDISTKYNPIQWLTKYRYAAIWIGILLVSGILIWQWQGGSLQAKVVLTEKVNLRSIPVRYVLPDSSEVFLATGSKISYPETFSGNTREINLTGEAFFQVTHHPERPFIVHTGDVNTNVLGTSFKVTALEGRPLEVAVATGRVGVRNQDTLLATLTPGNKVTWDEKIRKVVMEQINIDRLEQWKNGDMVFDRLDMASIAGELQRRYGVTLTFVDQEIKDNRVSGTFAASKTISQVMKMLAMAGKFRYETPDNKTFIIYKEN